MQDPVEPEPIDPDPVDPELGGADSRSVEGILAEHLARSWSIDVDELARENPERAEELREMGEIMGAVLGAFRELGDEGDDTLPPIGEGGEGDGAIETQETLALSGEEDPSGEEGPSGAEPVREPRPDLGARMPSQVFLRRLAVHRPVHPRYRIQDELGRGGMGTVLRVHDNDLFRTLAMKVAHGDARSAGRGEKVAVRTLERFLNEAQITGRLEHPGIVPVHELGIDDDGRVFFTMPLVKGHDLHDVFEQFGRGEGDWTRARLLEVLLKVCDAVGFAHEHRILHRDLKPSNVMVGRNGEVYVVDWGLARVLGTSDVNDLRIDDDPSPSKAGDTERIDLDERFAGSDMQPLRTMDGEVLGTPAYMSPEQARGDIEHMGPPSDVYSVGAILYELLAGAPPYVGEMENVHPRRIWSRVLEGPPKRLEELDPSLPPELVSICERAMARDMKTRYPDTCAMADDLRAHLEGRVVAAHRTGAWPEFTKWVKRNRRVASTVTVLVLALLGSIGAAALVQSARARESQENERRMSLLFAADRAQLLLEEACRDWPLNEEGARDLDAWLARAEDLRREAPGLLRERRTATVQAAERADLDRPLGVEGMLALRVTEFREVLGMDPDPFAQRPDLRELFEGEFDVLESIVSDLTRRRMSTSLHTVAGVDADELTEAELVLDQALELLGDEDQGWLADMRRTRSSWDRAIAARDDPRWTPVLEELAAGARPYPALDLPPQTGLVPLGRDPVSGLFEFHHVLSGAEPERDVQDRLVIEPETGIVLVLLPGGESWMGAQGRDPEGVNYDLEAAADTSRQWGPPVEARLEPFLISKYELTQDQWLRMAGSRPSEIYVGWLFQGGPAIRGDHPVEQVSWFEAMGTLQRYGLTLPTEAQWEFGARGGVDLPHWFAYEVGQGFTPEQVADWCSGRGIPGPHDFDGWPGHAPVDSFDPNPFGLYHVLGNVHEWCRELFVADLGSARVDLATAELVGEQWVGGSRPYRGGGWRDTIRTLRASARYSKFADSSDYDLGVRPARPLETYP